MTKQTIQQELDAILHTLTLFPDGASIEEIKNTLQLPINQLRTLQRRLFSLVKEKHVLAEGALRNRRYKLPLEKNNAVKLNVEEEKREGFSLSASADAIRKKVCQPLNLRKPVGYNREFLENYRPNITNYLPELTLKHLQEIGGTNGERPVGTYAKQVFNRLLIDLSWNSSRLEGNTYSLLETERLLKLSEIIEGKDLKEARMILNHKEAIEFLVESVEDIGINRYTILNLHAILSYDLLGDPDACGRLRSIPVGIGKSIYHPPAIPLVIEECFQQILDTASRISNPFEQSFFLMVHLPYLQPFEDVNKRVSRLAANIPLIVHNLCPLSFVDVSVQTYTEGLLGVYELNQIELLREVFIWAYERSCLLYSAKRKELGEPDPFRMRYRNLIRDTITSIIHGKMDRSATVEFIKNRAYEAVPLEVQARFIEVIEIEIMCLHEGNVARYKLKYSEYEAWRAFWR